MTPKKPANNGLITKSSLREAALVHRGETKPDSLAICGLLELFLADVAGYVVIYDALDGEVDLGPLWEGQTKGGDGSTWAITRTPVESMDLTCHKVSVELELHRWGYRQPVADAPQIADAEIGAVLVPGLAFDTKGGRIGWGAGYYDRFLTRLTQSALRIGVSDGYLVDHVPMDDHDVPMTHVVTADGVITTGA